MYRCRPLVDAVFATLALLAAITAVAPTASAHPHVFVTNAATIVFDKGAIVAIDHVWTFDEFYTAMAIEGLDTNKDGKYSREELHDLAKTNMEGLKEFGYFTAATLAGAELKVTDPADYWLEHKDNVLSLHFRLPLEKPVLGEAKGFAFSVYDPSYFIAFELAAKEPVKLSDTAPKTCKFTVGVPKMEADQAKKLSESFFQSLGGANAGLGIAKTISVACGA